MKLLFVVTEDWYFHSHRLPLAMAAKARGLDVAIATRVHAHRELIEAQGIRVIPLEKLIRSSLNPFRELQAVVELYSVIGRERPDIVHSVAIKPVIYSSVVNIIRNVPSRVNALGGLGFAFSSRNFRAKILRSAIIQMFRLLLKRRGTSVIVQNKEDLQVMTGICGLDQAQVHLIRGAGVDLTSYRPIAAPAGAPVVMLASRMLWDKGVGEFVEAAKILRNQGVVARFVLVGKPDGENPASVKEQQLLEWHNEQAIEWWGYRADMPQTLSEASIVCLPTYYGEGVPKILIEAMACGRAIVTTDTPGCRDLIPDGQNGILIQPRDTADLANAIKAILTDDAKRQGFGIEGRRLAETDFSLSGVIDETFRIYGISS